MLFERKDAVYKATNAINIYVIASRYVCGSDNNNNNKNGEKKPNYPRIPLSLVHTKRF